MCTKQTDNIYFWRQVFVLSSFLLSSLSGGIMIAFPRVLTRSLVSPNDTDIKVTTAETWIAKSNSITGVLSIFILPLIMEIFGRRSVLIICNLSALLGWMTFTFANNVTSLFVVRILQGFEIVGFITVMIIFSEYLNPKRRGYSHVLKKLSTSAGVLICHLLATSYSWRQIAAIAMVPNLLAVIMIFFFPESPPYLAMRGRFEDCEKSFCWLNGHTLEGKQEVNALIASQSMKMTNKETNFCGNLLNKLGKREFQKALVMSILLIVIIETCGRPHFVAYVIQLMIKLVGEYHAVYCSIGADFLILFALIVACFIIGYFNRRTILFYFGTFSVSIMALISLILFLKLKYNYMADLTWLTPSIVMFYSFVVNFSVIPVCFGIIAEVFPLEHRAIGSCTLGIFVTAIYAISLRLTPILIEKCGLECTYAIYSLCMLICLMILYFMVPETRDKTLQDIEDELKGVDRWTEDVEPINVVEEKIFYR